jgi:hypothetical protein
MPVFIFCNDGFFYLLNICDIKRKLEVVKPKAKLFILVLLFSLSGFAQELNTIMMNMTVMPMKLSSQQNMNLPPKKVLSQEELNTLTLNTKCTEET